MLRLNLLGGVNLLDSDGAPCGSRLSPRPMALLVFLAIEGRARAVRRDRTAALLWPESDQQKARASLTQALYDLRKTLGDHVVWSRGKEEIGVDVARLTCDCFEFMEHAAAGSLEDCVALYGGDFAAGLYARDAHAFEEWLEQQRVHWRAAYAKVLIELQRSALAHDDLRQAAAWTERLIEVAPTDEAPVRSLLPLLVERGQTGSAVRLFEVFEHKLRDYLEIDPPADLVELIAGVRARDARPVSAPIHVGAVKWLRPRRTRAILGAAAVAMVVFVGAGLAITLRPSAARPDTSYLTDVAAPAIVVVPIEHSADPLAKRTSAVLSEALQWRLRESGFKVLSGEGVRDVAEIAQALRTTNPASLAFVVSGDLKSSSDGAVTTTLQITDANTRKVLWSQEFNERAPDLYNVGTDLSEAVTAEIRRALGRVIEITPAGVKPSVEHWNAVFRAREHLEGAREMRTAGAVSGANNELQVADSILAEVAETEPNWPLPWLLRARVAEARAYVALVTSTDDGRKGRNALDRGIDILDSAIKRLPAAELLERRGSLKFRRFLFGVDDVDEAGTLLKSAEADLRGALAGGRRSDSYVMLSGVALAQGNFPEAYVFAGRAYQTNVFLRQNEEILARLFNSAFNSNDDRSADHWCEEIRRVLPEHWPAVLCRIELAAVSKKHIEGIQSEIERLAGPPPVLAVMQPRLLAAYSNMLARRGMADSARVVLRQTLGQESRDPELLAFNAFTLRALGDIAESSALIEQYLASNRGTRSWILNSRWLN